MDDPFRAVGDLLRDIPKPTTVSSVAASMPAQRRRLELQWADDLQTDGHAPPQLVDGLIAEGSFVLLSGQPNAGKSWVALDLARCVATGAPWLGRQVAQGGVAYLALEGRAGVNSRLAGFATYYGAAHSQLAVLSGPLDLTNLLDEVQELIRQLKDAFAEKGVPLKLVVVDTLARAAPDFDENSGRDMGRIIAGVDMLKAALGSSVVLVHHEGKTQGAGPRGHSSLIAAADTAMVVEKAPGGMRLKVTKQRDLARPTSETQLRLRGISNGTVSTCVVVFDDRHWREGKDELDEDQDCRHDREVFQFFEKELINGPQTVKRLRKRWIDGQGLPVGTDPVFRGPTAEARRKRFDRNIKPACEAGLVAVCDEGASLESIGQIGQDGHVQEIIVSKQMDLDGQDSGL